MNNQFGTVILCLLIALAVILIIGICFLFVSSFIENDDDIYTGLMLAVLAAIWMILSHYIYFNSYMPTATWL